MQNLWNWLLAFVATDAFTAVLRGMLILAIGLPVIRIATRAFGTFLSKRLSLPHHQIFQRVISYALHGLIFFTALRELGFDLSVILGAAGILTVAIGFASQTSASNLIAGLFLMGERSFDVGDFIQVGTSTGTVLAIDLLSVKLQTADNLFVRVPNDALIKAEIINYTRFPIRRMSILVGIAYRCDVAAARQAILQALAEHPKCLAEPPPQVFFTQFGESEQSLEVRVWARREDYIETLGRLRETIKAALDAAGMEIPFPHRTLFHHPATGANALPPAAEAHPDAEAN